MPEIFYQDLSEKNPHIMQEQIRNSKMVIQIGSVKFD